MITSHTVTVIGRYDSKTGIGQHSKAFIKTLKDKLPIEYLNTRESLTTREK